MEDLITEGVKDDLLFFIFEKLYHNKQTNFTNDVEKLGVEVNATLKDQASLPTQQAGPTAQASLLQGFSPHLQSLSALPPTQSSLPPAANTSASILGTHFQTLKNQAMNQSLISPVAGMMEKFLSSSFSWSSSAQLSLTKAPVLHEPLPHYSLAKETKKPFGLRFSFSLTLASNFPQALAFLDLAFPTNKR
jgi:hypothetical protein